MNIHSFHPVIQKCRSEFLHIQILIHLANKPVDVLGLFFLFDDFFFQTKKSLFPIILFPLIIIGQHLKPTVAQFPIRIIFINALVEPVQFFRSSFSLNKLSALRCWRPLCFNTLLVSRCPAKLFFIMWDTGNHQTQRFKHTLFQNYRSDEMPGADIFPF